MTADLKSTPGAYVAPLKASLPRWVIRYADGMWHSSYGKASDWSDREYYRSGEQAKSALWDLRGKGSTCKLVRVERRIRSR